MSNRASPIACSACPARQANAFRADRFRCPDGKLNKVATYTVSQPKNELTALSSQYSLAILSFWGYSKVDCFKAVVWDWASLCFGARHSKADCFKQSALTRRSERKAGRLAFVTDDCWNSDSASAFVCSYASLITTALKQSRLTAHGW